MKIWWSIRIWISNLQLVEDYLLVGSLSIGHSHGNQTLHQRVEEIRIFMYLSMHFFLLCNFWRSSMSAIKANVIKTQLWWAGHVIWMEVLCLPKTVFFSELATGVRNLGRPLPIQQKPCDSMWATCGPPDRRRPSCGPHGIASFLLAW